MVFSSGKIILDTNIIIAALMYLPTVLLTDPTQIIIFVFFSLDMLSNLFYTLNFAFVLMITLSIMFVSLLIILSICSSKTCRTIHHIPLGNVAIMSTFYAIRAFSASIYGFHEDWARNQPICALSGYITLVACAGVCYSYLVQALSRIFFILLLKYKYLREGP